ncbi:MAG: topoisomerase DNA-binding C4 zinc finger domain-containing protein [Dehalococcoidia bacterium]|nr:topoisomerase DNA-binding C4 zinc finger domain-containing protein [Dehalococcoidia bacterium]
MRFPRRRPGRHRLPRRSRTPANSWRKQTKRGKFWGCWNYPNCSYDQRPRSSRRRNRCRSAKRPRTGNYSSGTREESGIRGGNAKQAPRSAPGRRAKEGRYSRCARGNGVAGLSNLARSNQWRPQDQMDTGRLAIDGTQAAEGFDCHCLRSSASPRDLLWPQSRR